MPQIRSRTAGLVGLTWNWGLAARGVVRRFAREGWRPDIVHVHADGQSDALLIASWVREKLNLPLVITLHCSRIASYRPMNRLDRLLHSRVVSLERRALAAADAVICLTDRTAAAVRSAAYSAQVCVFPDILDDTFHARSRLPTTTRGPVHTFAFVGRIAHEKGCGALLDMLGDERLEDWQLLVIGDGPERAQFERVAARRGLTSRIRITGFQSHSRVADLLLSADALVMPSTHEEFGGAAIEAMALGVPVIAYAVGGLVNSVGQVAPDMLAEPGDIAGLVDRLIIATQAAGVRNDTIQAARQWTNRCAASTILPEFLRLYQSIKHRKTA
jgi:2-deoxystreptamine N-acetyl-D-glucosaminyltransferase/2-deoxystreptamine glucosyltransferase